MAAPATSGKPITSPTATLHDLALSLRLKIVTFHIISRRPDIQAQSYRYLVLTIPALPLLFDFFCTWIGSPSIPHLLANMEAGTDVWLGCFTVLVYALIFFPVFALNRWTRHAHEFSHFIGTDTNRAFLIRWMDKRWGLGFQTFGCIAAGVSSVVLVAFASNQIETVSVVPIPVYVLLFMASFFGSNAVYWLWQSGLLLRVIGSFNNLAIRWNSPASTPMIINLSRMLGFAALLCAIGVALTFTPAIYFYGHIGGSGALLVADLLALGIGLSTLCVVGLLPQVWLAKLIQREKRSSLTVISRQLPLAARDIATQPTVHGKAIEPWVTSYDLIHKSPSTAISIEPIIAYSAAVLAALVPVMFQLFGPHASG